MRSLLACSFVLLAAGCLDYGSASKPTSDGGRADLAGTDAAGVQDASSSDDAAPGDAAFISSIQFVDYNEAAESGPIIALAPPAGTMAGDYVLIAVRTDSGSSNLTTGPVCSHAASLAGADFSMFWCVHVCTTTTESYSFTFDQGDSLRAYAASYRGIGSTSDAMTVSDTEGSMQPLDAPPGAAVVAMLGFEMLGTSVPAWPEPPGFESPPQIDGLVFFDSGIHDPVPASFSFAGFDRGDNLTAFVTLKPL